MMKQKILSVILILSMLITILPVQVFAEETTGTEGSTSTQIEVNETTFPDENFRNYIISEILDGGTVLTEDDISKVKVLWLGKLKIKDITGIEYFKYLEELDLQSNRLTFIPELPNSLKKLDIASNNVSELPVLSENLVYLQLANNCLEKIQLNEDAEYVYICLEMNCIEDKAYITGKNDIQWDVDQRFVFGEQNCAHDWELIHENNAHWCLEYSYKTYYCKKCEEYKEEKGERLEHKWSDEHHIYDSPTCTEEGTEYIVCERCWEVMEDTKQSVPATGHTWKLFVEKEPTCTETGIGYNRCIDCREMQSDSQENIPAAGHTWETNYTIDSKPNCTETGIKSIHCEICDTIKENSEVVIPIQHRWDMEYTIDRAPAL